MGDHTVRKLAPDGTLLYILGNKGVPADTGCVRFFNEITHGGPPFHMPTQVAIGPGGDLYISDGYGNCRIHQFKPDGTYIRSWGEPGTGPGQFNLVHAVWAHTDGRLFVCDRENSRVQVFREDGTFLQEWTDCVRPDDLCIGADGRVYVAELGERAGIFPFFPNPLGQSRPGRVTVRDLDGRLLGTWGNDDPYAPDGMFAPHGIAVDSRGDVYVAEVAWSGGGRTGLVDCKRKAAFTKYVRVD
jgi:sugar lactone lactonase YvrE